MSYFSLIAIAAILAVHGYCVFGGAHLWPFTSYPMYANNWSILSTATYRASLDFGDGHWEWWQPGHYKDKQELSISFGFAACSSARKDEFGDTARQLLSKYVVADLVGRAGRRPMPRRIRVVRRTVILRDGRPAVDDMLLYQVRLDRAPG